LFYFILVYEGNNFLDLAKLLKDTHQHQKYNTDAETPLNKSILRPWLPDGLIMILIQDPPEHFCEVFVGEVNSPRVIWNRQMRQHLISLTAQHLGHFPSLLRENHVAVYDYCPMPGIRYEGLEHEVFCHSYYLNNLIEQKSQHDCVEISEPVAVFQACLAEWKVQIKRETRLEMSEKEESLQVLGLSENDNAMALRKAYRRLARQFHPDKNPHGRDKFLQIQHAYELLLPILKDVDCGSTIGELSQGTIISLLIKTQILILQQYPSLMKNLTFPSYDCLLLTLTLPPLGEDTATKFEFLATVVSLALKTCQVCETNGEELIREDGMAILSKSLRKYLVNYSDSMSKNGASANLIIGLIQTLSLLFQFPSGREAVPSSLLHDWIHCLSFPSLICYALDGIPHLSVDRNICEELIKGGVLLYLLPLTLFYDTTLRLENDASIVAEENKNAVQAVMALKALCMTVTSVTKALESCYTPPVAKMLLQRKDATEVLAILNSSQGDVERSTLLWKSAMTNELIQFITAQQQCATTSVHDSLRSLSEFQYDCLKNEIVIDGVYIRVFNKLGGGREAMSDVTSAANLAREILLFIKDQCMRNDDVRAKEEITSVVLSLKYMVGMDGLVDHVICEEGNWGVLCTLLEIMESSGEAYNLTCDILSLISTKRSVADALSGQKQLYRLLRLLSPPCAIVANRLWTILESLASSSSIAHEMLVTSAWLELLGIVVGYKDFSWSDRVGGVTILKRLLWDATVGPMLAPLLMRFLPSSLITTLKESSSPDIFLRTFDKNSNHPELIWDESLRSTLRGSLRTLLMHAPCNGTDYTLPAGFNVFYEVLEKELYIGGVYIKLFLTEPSVALSDPNKFLEAIVTQWLRDSEALAVTSAPILPSKQESTETALVTTNISHDKLITITSAIVTICTIHPLLCDLLSPWGLLPRLIDCLTLAAANNPIIICSVKLLRVAVTRRINVETLASCGVVEALMEAIGWEELHADGALMMQVLKMVYEEALGDIDVKTEQNELDEKESVTHDDNPHDNVTLEESLDNNHDSISHKSSNISSDKSSSDDMLENNIADNPQQPSLSSTNLPLEAPPLPPMTIEHAVHYDNHFRPPSDHEEQHPNLSLLPGTETSATTEAKESPLQKDEQLFGCGPLLLSPDDDDDDSEYNTYGTTPAVTNTNHMLQETKEITDDGSILQPSLQNHFYQTSNGEASMHHQLSQQLPPPPPPQSPPPPPPSPRTKAQQLLQSHPGAPDCSAKCRVSLLNTALSSSLPSFIISFLLNPVLCNIENSQMAKREAVALLTFLTNDPGYGPMFRLVLEGVEGHERFQGRNYGLFLEDNKKVAGDAHLMIQSGTHENRIEV